MPRLGLRAVAGACLLPIAVALGMAGCKRNPPASLPLANPIDSAPNAAAVATATPVTATPVTAAPVTAAPATATAAAGSAETTTSDEPLALRPVVRALDETVQVDEIVREAMRWVDADHPPDRDAEAVALLRLGRKLAQREATSMGATRHAGETLGAWIDRFLEGLYPDGSACRKPSASDLAQAYAVRRGLYVHPDVFELFDAQWICCPREAAPCVGDAAIADCMAQGLAAAPALFAAMAAAAPDRSAVEAAVEAARANEPRWTSNGYRVAYDYDSPHRQQPGRWLVLDEALVNELQATQSGQVAGPVQSEYGVHVLFVVEHKTKTNKDLTDDHVRSELERALCDEQRAHAKKGYLTQLAKGAHPEWDAAGLADAKEALVEATRRWEAEQRSRRATGD